jgi:alpha-galactosidase
MSPVIWYGDLYHLVSPYDENRAVLMYVDSTQNKAVVFNYNLNTRFGEQLDEVKLHALDANKKYKIEEINLVPGSKPVTIYHDKIYSGDYLMKIGLQFHKGRPVPLSSIVLLLTAQ